MLSNLSSDEYYLMGLKREEIPSPKTTVTAVFTKIELEAPPSEFSLHPDNVDEWNYLW